MSKRKCHLCDEPTVDKYCINESCAEYQRDEKLFVDKIYINFTQNDLDVMQEKINLLSQREQIEVFEWSFKTVKEERYIETIITVGKDEE